MLAQTWLATSAKMTNVLLNLFSSGKYVDDIIRVIFAGVTLNDK
jgi:hypothetical protein